MLMCRGVRGATTADENTSEAILQATRELLALMIRENDIRPEEVACIFFTTSPDLNSQFPALAARQLGWMHVPLLCGHEMGVPGSLEKCIRIMILWNTEKSAQDIVHVYVKGAETLRPDLSSIPPVDPQELEAWIADRFPDEAS
ncbi:MAG: chorismate mutase [Planctomycetota bacterium]|nr:MAG: chorismate mutase [Planctomycetota bacterium]